MCVYLFLDKKNKSFPNIEKNSRQNMQMDFHIFSSVFFFLHI